MENKDNVAPEPINKSTERGRWNSGSASGILGGILTDSRGNISDGTKSPIAEIDRHHKTLRKSLYRDCIVIWTAPFESVFIELMALIDVVHAMRGSFKRSTKFSEMKLAEAHVSNNARHSIIQRSRSRTRIVAVVSNCGETVGRDAARHVASSPCFAASHSSCVVLGLIVSVFVGVFAVVCLSKCKSELCRFWQMVQVV